eukprot:1189364-Prorocentrum_minimum.AAC.1
MIRVAFAAVPRFCTTGAPARDSRVHACCVHKRKFHMCRDLWLPKLWLSATTYETICIEFIVGASFSRIKNPCDLAANQSKAGIACSICPTFRVLTSP